VTSGLDSGPAEPTFVVLFAHAHFEASVWVFEDHSFDQRAVGVEWLVDDVYHVPTRAWVAAGVPFKVEDVGGVLVAESELDGVFVGFVAEVVGCGAGGDAVESFFVGGAEQVHSVSHQNVPDHDGVFDRGVFLVVESAVEQVVLGTAETELVADCEELVFEPVWAVVGSESFGVSVPEFDAAIW